jgi:hypothetical protein
VIFINQSLQSEVVLCAFAFDWEFALVWPMLKYWFLKRHACSCYKIRLCPYLDLRLNCEFRSDASWELWLLQDAEKTLGTQKTNPAYTMALKKICALGTAEARVRQVSLLNWLYACPGWGFNAAVSAAYSEAHFRSLTNTFDLDKFFSSMSISKKFVDQTP